MQWGIGDVVLTLPLLDALRHAYPNASIEPIGKAALASLLGNGENFGPFHRLVPPWTAPTRKYAIWDRQWRGYIRDLLALRRIRFDLLVSTRCDPRDSIQSRLLRADSVAGFSDAGGRHWFTVDSGISGEAFHSRPRAQVMTEFALTLTGRSVDPVPHLEAAPSDGAAKVLLNKHGYRGGPILAVSFGAAHPIRRWDSNKIAAILSAIGSMVGFITLIMDPADTGPEIELPAGVPSMVWRSDLAGIKRLLVEVDLLFCADSGIMHMASALGTKVVAVFGPGSPVMFRPSGAKDIVIAVEPMLCRPCYDRCIHPRPICLDTITPDQVVPVLRQALLSVVGCES